MKKTLVLPLALLLAAAWTQAQNAALNTFIDQHRNEPEFSFAYLSKDLLELVNDKQGQFDKKDVEHLHKVVKNLGSLTILAADSIQSALAVYQEARDLVPADEYDELLTVRDGSDHVHIWSKDDGSALTDVILLVGSNEDFVLICFSGQLDLSRISELASLFSAEEATSLAQTADVVAIDFVISPNPSRGDFTLSNIESQDTPGTLTVTNQQGRQVATRQLNESATQSISLTELPAGLYWIQLTTKQGHIGVRQVQVVK